MLGFRDFRRADIGAELNTTSTHQGIAIVPPAEEPEDMPLPSDPSAAFTLLVSRYHRPACDAYR